LSRNLNKNENCIHKKVLKDPENELTELDDYEDFEPLFKKIITEKGPDAGKFEAFFRSLRFELEMPDLSTIEDQLENKLGFFGLVVSMSSRLLTLVVKWMNSQVPYLTAKFS
jgi:hypothetical protein